MTTCRCCNHPMDAQEQSAYVPGRAPTILITCWNAFCALRAFTFTAEDYPTMDLTTYCPDAPIDDATRQMQARVARITERLQCFGIEGIDGACGENGVETAQDAICGVLPDAVDTTSPHAPTGVATRADGTPLNAMQQTLYARYGMVIEPLLPTARERTDGERRALAHAAEKRAQAAGIENAREWRRVLGI